MSYVGISRIQTRKDLLSVAEHFQLNNLYQKRHLFLKVKEANASILWPRTDNNFKVVRIVDFDDSGVLLLKNELNRLSLATKPNGIQLNMVFPPITELVDFMNQSGLPFFMLRIRKDSFEAARNSTDVFLKMIRKYTNYSLIDYLVFNADSESLPYFKAVKESGIPVGLSVVGNIEAVKSFVAIDPKVSIEIETILLKEMKEFLDMSKTIGG